MNPRNIFNFARKVQFKGLTHKFAQRFGAVAPKHHDDHHQVASKHHDDHHQVAGKHHDDHHHDAAHGSHCYVNPAP